VSCDYSGVVLPPGDYKVAVVNGAASPEMRNAATLDYWTTGPGASGIISGPLTAPNLAGATAPGQGSYNQGPSFVYPDTSDTGGAPAYWVDLEVRPTSAPAPPPAPQPANSNAFLAFF
jgi:hypothetical protein